MIDLSVSGLDGLMADIRKAENIPPDVLKNMVTKQADVAEKAIVFNAATMLTGPYYEGAVAASVKAGKARVSGSGATVVIKFQGTQHGNRLGEIAFVNEYGKKRQPARPFIKKATKEAQDPGADEARKVLDSFLSSRGL